MGHGTMVYQVGANPAPNRERRDMLDCSNCGTNFEVNLYVVYETEDFQDIVCPCCEQEFSIYHEE